MNKRAKSNSIRIIAGQWRGRKLDVLDAPGLRPTTDRVRETVFNWLMYDVQGKHCLDLFAGTGVLGLEALSRGANHVQFVELSARVAKAIESNLAMLHASSEHYAVSAQSAAAFLTAQPAKPFDLVFLDPPFADDQLPTVIEQLSQPGWLSEQALVYVEQPTKQPPVQVPSNWGLHREGNAGQSRYRLYSLSGTY